jgi:hypothetical protein
MPKHRPHRRSPLKRQSDSRSAGKSDRLIYLEERFVTCGRRWDDLRHDPTTPPALIREVRFEFACLEFSIREERQACAHALQRKAAHEAH